MRIDSLDIEEFANGEHRGNTVEDIGGENLLFQDGSRTGKTLTFNALLYNILGARHTTDLAVGRQNEVGVKFTDGTRFFRGNPRSEYGYESQASTGTEASEDLEDRIGSSDLIKSHFVHSHLGKMPLDNLSRNRRISLIRAVTDDELRRRLSKLERAEEQLEQLVVETKDDSRRILQDLDDVERQIRDLESQKSKHEDIQEKIESGELAEISSQLQKNKQLEDEAEKEEKQNVLKCLSELEYKEALDNLEKLERPEEYHIHLNFDH